MIHGTSEAAAGSGDPPPNPYFVESEIRSMSRLGSPVKPSSWRWLFLAGAALFPFPIAACFIIVTREWIVVDTTWDIVGLGLSLAAGIFCLWQLPISRLACVLLTMVYIPVVVPPLFHFCLIFIGQRYNLWL